MPTLLLVDDEPNVLYSLEKGLRAEGLTIITASTAKAGIEAVKRHRPDAVICDVRLPDMSGLDAFIAMRQIDARLPVIIITAHATTETAIEAMKRGAFDYLLKPYELSELRTTVGKALELSRLNRIPAVFDTGGPLAVGTSEQPVDRIIGTSRSMQEVYKEVGRVAPQNVNVLILGESGTGKELVARAIFQHSARTEKPFLAINCAAIPEALLESELFGHEKGAFTSADRRRLGKFEQAHGGTLFLDEIGDMSLATQAKVLRVLQDGRFERVGGNETIQSDVRVIAATNRNLDAAIAKQIFREDLFYRLNTFTIRLPSLRERADDLPQLIEHFINQFSHDLGKSVQHVAPDCLARLGNHSWPGNVRELQSAIKYALVRSTSDIITVDCLPASFGAEAQVGTDVARSTSTDHVELREWIRNLLSSGQDEVNAAVSAEVDRILYEEVLAHLNGNQSHAAERLGISRTTFRTRMQSLGLTVGKYVRPPEE